MLADLKAANPGWNIEIIGVNRKDGAASNPLITSVRTLPWLQDTPEDLVWDHWQVTYRDVRILDAQNRLRAVFNLSEHDLTLATNRAALKSLFLDAAKVVDVDADSLPDDWEMIRFGDLAARPGDDPDGDGFDNAAEFAWGTDPRNALSRPSFSPSLLRAGAEPFLRFTTRQHTGHPPNYSLSAASDLKQWLPAEPFLSHKPEFRNRFDGTGTADVTFTIPTSALPMQFFRMQAAP